MNELVEQAGPKHAASVPAEVPAGRPIRAVERTCLDLNGSYAGVLTMYAGSVREELVIAQTGCRAVKVRSRRSTRGPAAGIGQGQRRSGIANVYEIYSRISSDGFDGVMKAGVLFIEPCRMRDII